MRAYKFFWEAHKWTGVVLGGIFLMLSATGLLLLLKKDYAWIQPPTMRGGQGAAVDFISMDRLFAAVAHHPDFRTLEDIDRVDFRPSKGVFKVRSRHHHGEIQVDAVTGQVLSTDWRPSDLIESIHDGSYFGDWAHDWLMPTVAVALAFLAGSGFYLWLSLLLRRRRGRRRRARRARDRSARNPIEGAAIPDPGRS